jgi:hypothetical protein
MYIDENKLKSKAKLIVVIVICALMGTVFINIGTTFHEFVCHNLMARSLGCTTTSDVSVYSGVTSFNCPCLTSLGAILIALIAPIGCFLFGMFLWNIHPDHIVRAIGGIIMFYSSIPSLFPMIAASDMSFAIRHGFNLYAGWALYVLCAGVLFYEYFKEVQDREIFTKILN